MKKSQRSGLGAIEVIRQKLQQFTLRRPFLSGLFAVFATWGVFFLVLWPKMLYQNADGIWAGWINVWGDWAAHLSYASVFAYRPPADWFTSHPLFVGEKFTYPFLADAISGWLMRAGVNLIPAFIVPSIVLSLVLLYVMYKFYFMMLHSGKQAFVAITLNLLSGGLGFLWYLQDLAANPRLDTLVFPPREYTHMAENKIEWITLITSQLVPQRAFLLGLPIVLGLMIVLHKFMTAKKPVPDSNFILLGITSSLMLFIHVQAYIAFVFFCAAYALIYWRKWRSWFVFAVSAAIPASLLFSLLFGGAIHPGFFRFYPWWMANPDADNVNWLYFWWLNWGLFLPFSLFAVWKTKFYTHPLFIGAAAIFVATNLFLFQPFNWDNSKLLSFTYLVLCIPTAHYLAMLWRKRTPFIRGFAVACFIVMTLSGALDLNRMLHTDRVSNVLLDPEKIQLATQFRAISQPTDIVLTSDEHNHWVPTLTGRQIIMGYRGWLWTYGIDYGSRESDVQEMFAGDMNAATLLQKYNVNYVVIGPSERDLFHANEDFYRANYRLVISTPNYDVFRIQ
jgi:hypothetical protein